MACIMGINKNACRTAWLINEIWCQTQVAEHPLLIVVAPVYCLPPLEFQVCVRVCVWEVCGFWGVCATQFSIFGKLFFCVVLDFLSWVSPGLGRVEGAVGSFLPGSFLGFGMRGAKTKLTSITQCTHTQERSSESRSAATSWHQAPSPPSSLG